MERYERQRLITGWDQVQLSQARMMIVGTGWLGRFVSLLAAAMGFGSITLLGDQRLTYADQRFLLASCAEGSSVARQWVEKLRQINPAIDIDFVHDVPCDRSFESVEKPTIVIDVSTQLRWKAESVACAETCGARLILGAAGPKIGVCSLLPKLTRELIAFEGTVEDPLVSLALAALIVEEARQRVMPLESDVALSDQLLVSLEALHIRSGGAAAQTTDVSDAEVSMVGAGALGTWTAIGLGIGTNRPIHLRVYDPDRVDPTNLNRQVLFYGSEHDSKALVLSDRLNDQFPNLKVTGVVEAITRKAVREAVSADVVVSAPDNFGTRRLLHDGCVRYRIPLVNGGTSAFGADVEAYVPDRSPCLECSNRIVTVSKRREVAEARARCAHVAEPSVVTSNALAGAVMAYQVFATLNGTPSRGVIEYDARTEKRVGVRSVRGPCQCHT